MRSSLQCLLLAMTPMLILIARSAVGMQHHKPDYVQCTKDIDCLPGFCCSMTPQRYATPTCNLYRRLGETCVPGHPRTFNEEVNYPDGARVQLENVHYVLCPCHTGLVCDRLNGTCARRSDVQYYRNDAGDRSIDVDLLD